MSTDKIKVNLDAEAKLLDGKLVIWSETDGSSHPVSWGFMAYKAVASRYKGEEEMDFKAAYDRGKLAKRLFKGGYIELSPENLIEIKRLFAKRYDIDQLMGFAEALGMGNED